MTALPSWLQAGAAVIQAGVAIALYKITKEYVRLTGRLAAASEAQVELLRAERDDERSAPLRRLRSLAKRLLSGLQQLPDGSPEAVQQAATLFANAILPADPELQEFHAVATEVGPGVEALAQAAAENLRWLLDRARPAHENHITYDYRKLNWKEWAFRWGEADQALKKLVG
jgi:hypothetical protein